MNHTPFTKTLPSTHFPLLPNTVNHYNPTPHPQSPSTAQRNRFQASLLEILLPPEYLDIDFLLIKTDVWLRLTLIRPFFVFVVCGRACGIERVWMELRMMIFEAWVLEVEGWREGIEVWFWFCRL